MLLGHALPSSKRPVLADLDLRQVDLYTPAPAHPQPPATAGHVYRPTLARPSGKFLAMAGSLFLFVMTSIKRSESLTSGVGGLSPSSFIVYSFSI